MVKFGKKFFFNASYEKKTKTKIIIGGAVLGLAIIILIVALVANGGNKNANKKKTSNMIVRKDLTTEVFAALPDKASYFEKLENVDLDTITIAYPESMKITLDAKSCPQENLEVINGILDGTGEGNIKDYPCIKEVPSELGSYPVKVTIKDKEYSVMLNVLDTTTPVLTLKELTIAAGSSYDVKDFVESCTDNYDKECLVEYYYNTYKDSADKLDYSKYTEEGSYEIIISAYDTNGNLSLPLATKLTITPKAPNKYLVNFDSTGGTSINGQYVEEGKTIEKPTDPTRNNYTFTGWNLNGSAYDFSTPVTSDITLIAGWKAKNSTPQNPSVPRPVTPTPQTPSNPCPYGNKNYNSSKYILTVNASSSSSCAVSQSDISSLATQPIVTSIHAKDFQRVKDFVSSKGLDLSSFDYNYGVQKIPNSSNTGYVGYELSADVKQITNGVHVVVSSYRLNSNGSRVFSLNTLGLPN